MTIHQKTVLIVEDNALNMKLFTDLLASRGHRVVSTGDGMEVLELARQNKPDLILMDIQLPEISGIDVIRWLKNDEELKTVPIIAVTAFAMKGDNERILASGCQAYISKPISVPNFIETVDKHLAVNKSVTT